MAIIDFLTKKPITVKAFYEQHKSEILELVATEHLSRTDLSGLKYEITAKSGKRYYSFPEKMQLPFMRMAKGIELMDWLKNGISPEDFDQIRAELTVALAHIKAKTKDAQEYTTKAGLLISELERRRVQALPYYVLINLCANYLIREDEDPQIISSPIHHQKCDEIQAEIESGNNAFFLTIPQLKPLSLTQSLSGIELTEYLRELQAEAQKDKQLLSLYLSWTEQRPAKPTSSKAL
jgi:hypothetical protein